MPFTGKSIHPSDVILPEIAEDMADLVGIISPFETPLLNALGDAQVEARSTQHEWLEDEPGIRRAYRARRGNWTQIFSKVLSASRSRLGPAVNSDELDFQKTKTVRELLRYLENAVVNGIDLKKIPRKTKTFMDGILAQLKMNRFEAGVAGFPGGANLDEEKLNMALRLIWDRSSDQFVDLIAVNGCQKRVVSQLAGAKKANRYQSDFGVQRVILSPWVPRDACLLLDSSRIQVLPLAGRSFQYRPLAVTGDFEKGQVLGEYTLELRNEGAHGVIRGLATE